MTNAYVQIFLFLFLFISLGSSSLGQGDVEMTADAGNGSGRWQIELDFANTFTLVSARKARFSVVDLEGAAAIPIVGKPDIFTDGSAQSITLTLGQNANLNCDKTYIVYVKGLNFTAKQKVKEVFSRVTVRTGCTSQTAQTGRAIDRQESPYRLQKAKGSATRDSSDIYVSGLWSGASGKKVEQTFDIKVEPNLNKTVKSERVLQYGPSFEFQSSSASGGDADRVKLGGYVEFFPFKRNALSRFHLRNTAGIESNRGFTNTNLIWDSRVTYAPVPIKLRRNANCGETPCIYFRPFIGKEFGYNFKNPVDEAEKRLLFRPYLGGTIATKIPIGKLNLQSLSFSSSYIRRFPLKREVTFTKNDDGDLEAVSFGRRPKDRLITGLEFTLNDFWGVKVAHEYGSAPPLYKLIDHKFSFGFTFKGMFERAENE